MDISEETLQKIQKFVQNRESAENESSTEPLSATALHAYARRLDGTLQQLQEQVRRQEDELKKVCAARRCNSYMLLTLAASRKSWLSWSLGQSRRPLDARFSGSTR